MSTVKNLSADQLMFNGINGATGSYLLPPISARELSAFATGETQDKEHLADLKLRHNKSTQTKRGVKAGVDPLNLASSGWGVIFSAKDNDRVPAIKEALGGLLELRQSQAGNLYREYAADDGYQSGESYLNFLARQGIGPGPADPQRVPYYLLIVGDPETIPFDFQYQLDVQYAVGRIYFETLDQYEQYATSLVEAETGQLSVPRKAVFFGVENNDDPATQLSATHLVRPLAEHFLAHQPADTWEITPVVGEEATKSALSSVLVGAQSPALFFSASHGMGFPIDDPRQIPHQGALLCQDWPGPQTWKESIPEDFYFSADDVSEEARLSGSIAFHFACYGAGTPKMDYFAHQAFLEPKAIAPRAFMAQMPQRLLSHPNGGMLAVIGHVERAWGYSFAWQDAGSQLAVFESALKNLMKGIPVGYAMEYFNERYAELSTVLSTELQGIQFGKVVDDVALAGMWTANNDARSYVILGDPAVRLPIAQDGHIGIKKKMTKPLSAPEPAVQVVSGTNDPGIQFLVDERGEKRGSPSLLDPNLIQTGRDILIDLNLDDLNGVMNGESPLHRAVLHHLLANSYHVSLSGKHEDSFKNAVVQYRSALKGLDRDGQPEQWRQIQSFLLDAFTGLYSLTGVSRYYQSAQNIFSDVLYTLDPDDQPREWALLKLRMARLFSIVYGNSGDIQDAEKSLESYHQVLKVITRRDAPIIWAQAQFELGELRADLFANHGDDAFRTAAIENMLAVTRIFNGDSFPFQYVNAQIKLGDLYLNLDFSEEAGEIELAIQAYKAALERISEVSDLIPESSILTRLGDAYARRQDGNRAKNSFMASAYYKESLALMREYDDRSRIDELEIKIKKLSAG